MTTPAHSSDLTSGAGGPPVKTRSGMLAFYISTGVALVLLVAGYFAWTPLRIAYLEEQVLRHKSTGEGMAFAVHLVRMGPQASEALRRLISHDDREVRWCAGSGMDIAGGDWWASLAVGASQDKDDYVADQSLGALWRLSGESFCPQYPKAPQDVPAMLKWWEREGKAKYGRGE